ncbi:MAG: aminopeptidase P N-terminal domain-containing protein [Thermoanaerobaculia bacterium]
MFRRRLCGLMILALFAGVLHALDFPPISASPDMFREHREKFMARMAPNSIAVLRSAPRRVMSNDVEYIYRQDSNFYYLTGFEDPEAVAVLRPKAADGKRFLLFVRARNPRRETYEGKRPSPEEAAEARGADAGFTTDEFFNRLVRYDAATRTFSGYLADVEKIYLSDAGDTAWADKFREAVESMRARDTGPATVEDARHLAHELRVVKDAEEIKLIRRATEISGRGHERAMKAAAPGKYEFEVQHALDGYCYANGARRMAYPSIVGSGPNSISLHWERNDRQMKDGEVVLNDSGAEYGYYATDITRTYPVSGKFSPEQKAIYEVVLAAQKEAMAAVKPGRPHDEVGKASFRAQTAGLVKLGLLSGDVEKLVREGAHRRFTVHGVSHGVGLDVHDAGRYGNRPMEPGMTFTIEPGIYIPEGMEGVDKKWWNIGVRIEDVVLVTADGYECLSCSVPRELAVVEKTVRDKR